MTRGEGYKHRDRRRKHAANNWNRSLQTPGTPAAEALSIRGGEGIWEARDAGIANFANLVLNDRTTPAGEEYRKTVLSSASGLFDRLLNCVASGQGKLSAIDLSNRDDVLQLSAVALLLALKLDEDTENCTPRTVQIVTGCELIGLVDLEVNACVALEWRLYEPHLLSELDRLQRSLSFDDEHKAVAEYLLMVTTRYPCFYGMSVMVLATAAGKAAARVLGRKWPRDPIDGYGSHELGNLVVKLLRVGAEDERIRALYPAAAAAVTTFHCGDEEEQQ
ncbi:hypothetical protein HDU86_004552 [Geranomyces michiganensis]|nr:hypothetical protein HDU86_004552 [Geranomyces michiganensis]